MNALHIGSKRITILYLVLAGTAVCAILVAAWWIGRGTPAYETRRLSYIELRMLRQARDRIKNMLAELEFKVRSFAQQFPSDMPAGETSLQQVMDRTFGNIDLEGAQLRRFNRSGELMMEIPSGSQRIPKLTEEELTTLLAWNANVKSAGEVRSDVLQLPFRSDIQSRDVVRYVVSCYRDNHGVREPDGILCAWFPTTVLLSTYLIPTLLLPESYAFALYWEHSILDSSDVPTILWHSAEPQWIRSDASDAAIYLQALFQQSKILTESGEDSGVFELPRRDGKERKEVIALVTVDIGVKRWIIGLSTPYEVAVEFSAAQRSLMLLLTLLSLAILLVGVGLLFYQRTRMVLEAQEQRRKQIWKMQHDYRELFSENPTAMLVFNNDGVLADCNFSAERLLGYSKEEAVGKSWSDLFESGSFQPLWEALSAKGHLYARDTQLVREQDRSSVLVEAWGRRIGEHWILMAQNVEQRRDLEQQLARLKRMDSMGVLASALAHDFNNLLGQVQIMVSNLRTDVPESSSLAEDLSAIEKKVDDASEMVANLMASKEIVVANDPVPLEPLLTEFAGHLKRVVPKNITVEMQIPAEVPSIWLTPHALRRILDNLCLNACDAMPYGGTLVLRAHARQVDASSESEQLPAGRYAVIEVQDTGAGMSREVLDSIFEPFYTTKPKGKGTGIGLWTVYRVVRRVGGWIQVQSRVGAGTRFTLYLPHGRRPLDEPASRSLLPSLVAVTEKIDSEKPGKNRDGDDINSLRE